MKLKIYIISTGSEITAGKSLDTNSMWLANEMNGMGYSVNRFIVLPDKPDLIKTEIKKIMDDSGDKLILMTGGLGATADDYTLSVVCEITDKAMVTHEKAYEKLLYIAEKRGKAYQDILPISVRQTKIPATSIALENEVGLAPGFFIYLNSNTKLAAFPGVPREMKEMFSNSFIPVFKKNYEIKENNLFSKSIWGIGEGVFQETFIKNNQDWIQNNKIEWGVTAKPGYIKVSFRAEDDSQLKPIREKFFQTYQNIICDDIFSEVHDLLISSRSSVSTAESCTGGLVGKLITDISGSSIYYYGSVVAYHNDIKNKILGVKKETLDKYGSVSEETAEEMANGVQLIMNTHYSISVTGIAGPSGGTPEKKVGLVYIGIKSLKAKAEIYKYELNFSRDLFREYVANTALFLLYKRLRNDMGKD